MIAVRLATALTMIVLMVATGCTSSSSAGSDAGPTATAAVPTAAAGTGVDEGGDAGPCESETTEIDLWPELDAVAPEVAEQIRVATRGLTQPNRFSCQPMMVADPLVAAADVGAVAVASVEHDDPYVRIDLFAYESAEAAAATGTRDALLAALDDKLPDDAASEYSSPRPVLRFVTSWLDPDGTGDTPGDDLFSTTDDLRAAFDIALYYEQTIFGDE